MGKRNIFLTVVIVILVLAFGVYVFRFFRFPAENNPLPKETPRPSLPSGTPLPSIEVKMEANCTDKIDNDKDGLADSEDGECWVRDGAVFMEDYRPLRTFRDLEELVPQLKSIGVKTIEMFGLWEHSNPQSPGYRWATKDFSRLDPARGSEAGFKNFIDASHGAGLKIVPLTVSTVSIGPSAADCAEKSCKEKSHYDLEGEGGALYSYWKENPEKNIFIKNKNGNPVCDYTGYGFVVDLESPDVRSFFRDFYDKQITKRGLDGIRLDTPLDHTCQAGDKIYSSCDSPCACFDPALKKQDSLDFYRMMSRLKKPDQVFLSEAYYSRALHSDWGCAYPYYPPSTDFDELVEISEGYEFEHILGNHILKNPLSSSGFVDWVNNQPIEYGRQRFRMIRNSNGTSDAIIKFVAMDKRYYPAIVLASTIPGVPKLTDYELFGNTDYDNSIDIKPANSPESRLEYWKKVLNIRNSNNALKYGDIKNIWKSGDNVYAYSRAYGNEIAIIIINFSGRQNKSVLDIPFSAGVILIDELSGETFTVNDPAGFKISVPSYGSRILIIKQ